MASQAGQGMGHLCVRTAWDVLVLVCACTRVHAVLGGSGTTVASTMGYNTGIHGIRATTVHTALESMPLGQCAVV